MSSFALPLTWPERQRYIGDLNKRGTEVLIQDLLTDQPTTAFHGVLVRIIERLQEENSVLAFQNDASVPAVAWAARNILELRVIGRYICQSVRNLERFKNDVYISGTATQQALSRLSSSLAKEVGGQGPTEEIYRLHGANQAIRESSGLGNEGPLMARVCAKAVGLEKEYLAFSSITSPLVHPSSISILRTVDLEVYREILIRHGLILATRIIEEARDHIKQHGYKTAE